MVTQMAKYLDTVYVSGWQCSSTASSTDEPGPDLADYPYVSITLLRVLSSSDFDRQRCLTRLAICSWLRSSTIASNAKSASLHPKPIARNSPASTTCGPSSPMQTLATEA